MAAESLVLPEVVLRKVRRLPCEGEVTVKLGDLVRPTDVVARAKRPAEPVIVMVAQAIGAAPKEVTRLLRCWAGEPVTQNGVIAEKKGVLGLGKRVCRSPIDGFVLSGPHSNGEVVLGRPDEVLELLAGVPGRVVGMIPLRGVIIETPASYVQGIGGFGGEVLGTLRTVVSDPAAEITGGMFGDKAAAMILAGGYVGQPALAEAARWGVAGIIVGGISGEAYLWLLENRPPLTVVVTTGGGNAPMAPATFQLLQRRAGMPALLNGTPGLDGSADLIVPLPSPLKVAGLPRLDLEVGASARVDVGRWAGASGRIAALPVVPRVLPSGVAAPVAVLELEDGRTVTVARNNVTLTV